LNNLTNCGSASGVGTSGVAVAVSDSTGSVNQSYSMANEESIFSKSSNEEPAACQNFCI
jgi:hypothetical protein